MDFIEKAKIRIEHWISHNEHHQEEYEQFAVELENAGRKAAAKHIREMSEFTRKGTESLRKTLNAIETGGH